MSVKGLTKEAAQLVEQAWSGRQRLALAAFLFLLFAVITVEWWRRQPAGLRLSSASTAQPTPSTNPGSPILSRLELNRASADALSGLPGIGPKLAQRIVAYRDAHGPFRQVEDLRRVPGIGPKIFEKVRHFVYVENGNSPTQIVESEYASIGDNVPAPISWHYQTPSMQSPVNPVHYVMSSATAQVSDQNPANSFRVVQQPARPRQKEPPDRPMDINSASTEDLQRLPGIGPILAQRIVAERTENGPFCSLEELRRVRGIGPRTLEKLRPYVTVAPASTTSAKKLD